MDPIIEQIARELNQQPLHVENVVRLLDEGNTIPFIARYRKELHGAMDDTSLRALEERLAYLRGLQERREAVKKSIDEQGKLTAELSQAIDRAGTLAEVEDLYRPYKQKRRTRATAAREKGLAPLAEVLLAQAPDCPDRRRRPRSISTRTRAWRRRRTRWPAPATSLPSASAMTRRCAGACGSC